MLESKKPPRLPLPVPKLTAIDRKIPVEIQNLMGKNWHFFRSDLLNVLREHSATGKDVGGFLERTLPLMQKIVERMQSIPDIARRKPEDYFYIVASMFVAGYLHGIDPTLLLAIAHRESSFKPRPRSWRGARGYLQVTASSALSELLSWDSHHRNKTMAGLRQKLAKLTNIEFIGVKTPIGIRWVGKKPVLKHEEAIKQGNHALHNAVWAARTFLLKYAGKETEIPWGIGNAGAIKDALKRYQGGNASYAEQVYRLYVSIYKPIEDEVRISALPSRPKAPKI